MAGRTLSAVPGTPYLPDAAIRHALAVRLIAKGREDGTDDQQDQQNAVKPAACLFFDRFACATVRAFATFGRYRHLAQTAAGQLFVGTSHPWKLDIS